MYTYLFYVDIASGSMTESHVKNAQMMLNKQEQRLSKLEEKYEAQSKQAVVVDAELLKVNIHYGGQHMTSQGKDSLWWSTQNYSR